MASRLLLFLSLFLFFTGSNAVTFALKNLCLETIWVGILSGSGQPLLHSSGLKLVQNDQTTVEAPAGWSGRFWGRTGCNFNQSGKSGNCTTGDCSGLLECGNTVGAPPASLAEFTLGGPLDFYDISLVDGFNIPINIYVTGGSGNCSNVMCDKDLNEECPVKLRVVSGGKTVACKSACLAFNEPQYCCTGAYNDPKVCQPTNYSVYFKKVCPTAYSYPYDDASSTYTCKGAEQYLISFCSSF